MFEFWIAQGVTIFRVDNPHTKSFALLGMGDRARCATRHPEVIFLAEAFTRPKVMHRLAKLGFSQSYTYFTWRNTKQELTDYFTELAHGPGREYFRPNAWPNTPDILPAALQCGGRAVFMARRALAATLAANYGIYGPAFELLEAPRARAGRRGVPRLREVPSCASGTATTRRRWRPSSRCSTRPAATTRRCSRTAGLRFLAIDNEQMIAYAKSTPDGANVVVCVVNLDPHHVQSGWLESRPAGAGAGAEAGLPDARRADRRALPVAGRRATMSASTRSAARRT